MTTNNGNPADQSQNWYGQVQDYRDWLGHNIVEPDGTEEACPFDKPPKDAKDFAIYRQYHEEKMMQMMGGNGFFTVTARCWEVTKNGKARQLNFPKPGHKGAPLAISCPHVIVCDPVHPEDVFFTPFERDGRLGYYLCKTCFNLLEKKRLNIDTQTGLRCGACIEEEIIKMMSIDPAKYHDLRLIK